MTVQPTARNGIQDNSYYVNWRERIAGLEDLLVTRPDYRWNPEDRPACSTVPESWTKPAPQGAGRTEQEWLEQWHPVIQPGVDEPVRAIHECLGCPFQLQCLHEAVWHEGSGAVRAGVSGTGLVRIRSHLGITREANSVTPMLNKLARELERKKSEDAKAQHAESQARERDAEGRLLPSANPTPKALRKRASKAAKARAQQDKGIQARRDQAEQTETAA